MTSLVNSFLNRIHREIGAEGSPETRQEIIRKTEMIKVAAAVVILVSAIIFIAYLQLSTFCLLLPIVYLSYEIGMVAHNYQEIFEDWKTAIKVNLSDHQYVAQLTKRAPLARSITKILGPF